MQKFTLFAFARPKTFTFYTQVLLIFSLFYIPSTLSRVLYLFLYLSVLSLFFVFQQWKKYPKCRLTSFIFCIVYAYNYDCDRTRIHIVSVPIHYFHISICQTHSTSISDIIRVGTTIAHSQVSYTYE